MAERKKTPSARVIAAMWLVLQLDPAENDATLTPDALSLLADSRVSDKKVEQVCEFIDKLTGKFRERMQKIVSKFENPQPSARKKTPVPPRRRKHADEEE